MKGRVVLVLDIAKLVGAKRKLEICFFRSKFWGILLIICALFFGRGIGVAHYLEAI